MDLRSRVPNIAELARKLGVGYEHVFWCLKGCKNGRPYKASLLLSIQIEAETGGAILRHELRPEFLSGHNTPPPAA